MRLAPAGLHETWAKPLHDGSFAVVLLNKGEAPAQPVVSFGRRGAQSTGAAYMSTSLFSAWPGGGSSTNPNATRNEPGGRAVECA